MDEIRSLRPSRKGYDQDEVDAALSEFDERIRQIENERVSAEKTVERLNRDVAEARAALQRANSKPSFADLGSAFEQTLRVAEEQAAKMVKDGTAEAQVLRESARAEAEQITRVSRLRAEKLVGEAESRAEELRIESERRVSELNNQTEAKNTEVRTSLEIAQRKAATVIAEAEREASEIRSRVHQETEDVKTELQTLRQIAEREQFRIQREIKIALDESERERLTLHENAVAHSQNITSEANERMAMASIRAAELSAEAEDYIAHARTEAEALMSSARNTAAGLITRARARAEAFTMRFAENAANTVSDARARLARLEALEEVMDDFALALRALSSPDALVELDESEVQND